MLDARDYLAPRGRTRRYERDFLDALESWINSHRKDKDAEFYYLFSKTKTCEELKKEGLNDNPSYMAALRKRIAKYKNIESRFAGSFMLSMTDDPASGPHIVGDNIFAFWLFGDADALAISHENAALCDTISRMFQNRCRRMTLDEIISGLVP
ncbi:MAG: hypothetical protein P8123_08030 [bacterium]